MVIGIQNEILDGHHSFLQSFHTAHLKREFNFHHPGFRFVFRSLFRFNFRVSSCRERAVPGYLRGQPSAIRPLHSVGLTLRSSPQTRFNLWAATERAHFVFPHVLAASSVAGQTNRQYWKRRGQSRGIIPAHDTQLWDTEAAVGELGCDASSPLSACTAFLNWWASAKTVLVLEEEISSTFVPQSFTVLYTISRCGTKPQSHRVHFWPGNQHGELREFLARKILAISRS